jgi:predicted nucleotidyltransferase component of viral defense system
MLHPDEETAVADQFGVARMQVQRDHLISHLLAALNTHAADQVVFFGGTALSRTFAPDGRLSEDIDLIATGRRRDVAEVIQDGLLRATRREYPGLRWQPPLTAVRDTQPAVLTTTDGITVRIQLLRPDGYPNWPTTTRPLVQRYSDVPPATLTVFTAASFAASKTVAWAGRAATRDLFDLWLLARTGAVSGEAAGLFAQHGPTNKPPTSALFSQAPDETTWRRDLSGQTRLHITADEALTICPRGLELRHLDLRCIGRLVGR